MDGGAKQRAELTAIKLVVANMVKQRRALRANRRVGRVSSYDIPPGPIMAIDRMQDADSDSLFNNITLHLHHAPEVISALSSTQAEGSRDARRQNNQRKQENRNM